MNIILFFVILILNLSKIATMRFYVIGQLTKTNYTKVKDNGENWVYIDTNEYGNSDKIKIKVTTYNSFFMEDIMYYGWTNDVLYTIELNNSKKNDSYSASSSFYFDFRTFYFHFTYYYDIPVSSSERYLYVSIPKFSMYADTAITEIMVVETTGLSGGAIAGIVIGVVAVVTLAIIAFICYRKKRMGNSQDAYKPPTPTYTNNYKPPVVQPTYY